MAGDLPNNSALIMPVILCGGSGKRLWPLSRAGFPKQFLALSGDTSGKSLFQQSIQRVNIIGANSKLKLGPTLIVTNEEHRFLVQDQLLQLKNIQTNLLLEPDGRNTAPALTLAAFQAQEIAVNSFSQMSDPILVIAPADQTIANQMIFVKALQDCIVTVESDESKKTIATLGITPNAPETGYGYIKYRGQVDSNRALEVMGFVEKPDLKTAESYLKTGGYLWNSGIFILRASTWLDALREFRADIYMTTERAWRARTLDQSGDSRFIRPDPEIFKLIPSESIDYAVVEKCFGSNTHSKFSIKVIELDAGWNDLGAWDAVWKVGKQNKSGNVTSGDVIVDDVRNSLIYSNSRLVSAAGIEDLIIVETADAVLVTNRKSSQGVKPLVDILQSQQREEKNLHRKVARPWGWYDSLDQGERFKVKRIQVKPGSSLSLQKHQHRAEHWIVVKGLAEVTIGEKKFTLQENQSTYIPKGEIHRLTNPGTETLEIIEVQSGEYLGEDDIIRYEDTYGRI